MATRYVRTSGSDSNGGTSPADAWLTLAKALGASGIASGDTLYIGAGTYRANTQVAMTSPTAETRIIGDYTGAFTGDPGEVVLTPWLTTDTAGPSSTYTIDLNGRDFFTFENLTFLNPNNQPALRGTTANSTDITVRNCTFLNADESWGGIEMRTAANTPANWLIERCVFIGGTHGTQFDLARHTSDYDVNITVRNCLAIQGNSYMVRIGQTGSGTGYGGGVRMYHCTQLGGDGMMEVNAAEVSQAISNICAGCFGIVKGTAISANTNGQIIEDYNLLNNGGSIRSNTGIGPNTVGGSPSNYAPLIEIGQSALIGRIPRLAGTPLAGSPLIRYGSAMLYTAPPTTAADDATVGTVSWTNPSNALLPENVNFAVASSIPATTGVSHYLKITGGLSVPTNAVIVAVRVEVRYKASAGSAISFNSVKLVKAGVISGNDLASSLSTQWSTSAAIGSIGSSGDPLWGLSLSYSDVNASDFGVVISAKNTSGSAADASIDYVRMVVAYRNSDNSGISTVDLLNRPRPALAVNYAVGALERHDTGTKETSVVDAGPSAIRITDYGDQEIYIPVSTSSTTVSVKVRYDSNHGTSSKPQASILADDATGVSAQTVTATVGADTWETLTFSAFTPTAEGIIVLRLQSRSAAANGYAVFDTLSVS